jgi:enamine deaminase RidA (YjgF/YER057c/UK114 family)
MGGLMSRIEQRISELGLELAEPTRPVANYLSAVRVGQLVYVSGHGPKPDPNNEFVGKVGSDVDVETAYRAAGVTILNCLSTLRAEIGDLDKVEQVVKLLGMVNSAAGFNKQPQVINGASDRLVDIFGDRGRHARSAVGMAELPGDIAVEIELIVKLAD